MPDPVTILVLSDIHFASEAEMARGCSEYELVENRLLRACVKAYRHYIWRRDPFAHNHLLDSFLAEAGSAEYTIANGDYSCDTAFVGVSDNAAFESARQCVAMLRSRFGANLKLCLGDHELGKFSLFGRHGGLRLASWNRSINDLKLDPFWILRLGRYVLLGVTSSLLAFPVFEPESLPEEREQWNVLRADHLDRIREAFTNLQPCERLIIFCHDPTALPFLWQEEAIRAKSGQIEMTVIGHLHSNLILWKSRLLSGIPAVNFLGNSVRRMSAALNQARVWRQFSVRLCPALAGIELTRRPGYCQLVLDPGARGPIQFRFCSLPVRSEMDNRVPLRTRS